ncbi:MAG: hypothetical protein HLUCCA05_11670 [Roseibaca calidilacus]|uniref:Lipoprotein n=1 Tax=Roseibaca calidilacus TaxID=1666912 RepID=A0A0P7YV38_9RHOB|nr:hypothetical protein [Roseibaca calidilacus]KPP94471.1 MAG: hypothetical protein HLUCCA05_11670 [Roseibaca calidilacus]CUX83087.1 hypothetical protein Ga0058931_2767 [Roseibaca calidilacus]
MQAILSLRTLPQLRILVLVVLAVVTLSACAGERVWAPDAAVQAARYVHGGQAELTVVTVMNYSTKRGDHTALFINADERVLFDPAGSWKLPNVPERNDLHYGMTPQIGASYYLSHTRETHYTVVQRIPVSMETALRAKQLASEAGPVPPAHCAVSTIAILRELPGFGDLRSGYYPHRLMEQIAAKPGVITSELHYDAPSINADVYAVQSRL